MILETALTCVFAYVRTYVCACVYTCVRVLHHPHATAVKPRAIEKGFVRSKIPDRRDVHTRHRRRDLFAGYIRILVGRGEGVSRVDWLSAQSSLRFTRERDERATRIETRSD